jgi:hypothetical protein
VAIGLWAAEEANHVLLVTQDSAIFKRTKTRLRVHAVRVVVGKIGDMGRHKRLQG